MRRFVRFTQDGPVGQNMRGNSWDLYEVECWDLTGGGSRKIKLSPHSASHESYNNKYPLKNLVDGNKKTLWAGHPGKCSYKEHGGCQHATLAFDRTTKRFKCTLTQSANDKKWAVTKITMAQAAELGFGDISPKFSVPVKKTLNNLGSTPNIMACSTTKTCSFPPPPPPPSSIYCGIKKLPNNPFGSVIKCPRGMKCIAKTCKKPLLNYLGIVRR